MHHSCSLSGKGRGKRKKGASPVHPPLLLIQDPQTALNRLQERVSSLLLRSRPPSPPTPTLTPSVLPLHPQAPLWDKSALHEGGPDAVSEFYTSELSNFIQPWVAPEVRLFITFLINSPCLIMHKSTEGIISDKISTCIF